MLPLAAAGLFMKSPVGKKLGKAALGAVGKIFGKKKKKRNTEVETTAKAVAHDAVAQINEQYLGAGVPGDFNAHQALAAGVGAYAATSAGQKHVKKLSFEVVKKYWYLALPVVGLLVFGLFRLIVPGRRRPLPRRY